MVATNGVLLDPEAGTEATVLQGTHNLNEGRAVLFQPSTGRTRYLEMPGGSGSWSVLPVGGGEAWLGSHLHGFLYHLAPGAESLRRIDLPRPTPKSYEWIWSLDRGSDGLLYLGAYPEGALLRCHPESGRIEELGALNPDTSRSHYLRSITGQFPGKLFVGMGAQAELMEYDIATGQLTPMLPEKYRERSFVYHVERAGKYLAAGLSHHDDLLLFDPDTRQLVHALEAPDGRGLWMANRNSFIAVGEDIYFTTSGDDTLWAWNPEKDSLRVIREGIGRMVGLAAERYFFFMDAFAVYRILDTVTGEVIHEQPSRFEGNGMSLHALSTGPGQTVVGGIFINQGFFSYDESSQKLFAPGASISHGGQIDCLTTCNDKVYIGHYTTARISVYDPKQPWNPGLQDGANPRVIGEAGNDQDRFPHCLTAGNGRIYFGSIPDYGRLGGALVILDPASGKITTHRHVVENQSVYALAEVEGILYAGTAIVGGLGSAPSAHEAVIFAWDLQEDRKIREVTPVPGAREIWGLDALPDGRLIGAADGTFFLYDPRNDRVTVGPKTLPETVTKLLVSSDGWVYGLTHGRFFRISPDLLTLETIEEHPDYWDSLAESPAGSLYLGRGPELLQLVRPS